MNEGIQNSGPQEMEFEGSPTYHYFNADANAQAMNEWETGEDRLKLCHEEAERRNKKLREIS